MAIDSCKKSQDIGFKLRRFPMEKNGERLAKKRVRFLFGKSSILILEAHFGVVLLAVGLSAYESETSSDAEGRVK
jgi:hypothetical protein